LPPRSGPRAQRCIVRHARMRHQHRPGGSIGVFGFWSFKCKNYCCTQPYRPTGVGVSAKPDRLDSSVDGSELARRISLANPVASRRDEIECGSSGLQRPQSLLPTAVIVATLTPRVAPNHRCKYTHRPRGSEATVPILGFGMKAIGVGEQPLPRIVLGRSSLTSASVPKLMIFCFSC